MTLISKISLGTSEISSGNGQEKTDAASRLAAARALLAGETGLDDFFDALFAAAAPEDITRSTPAMLAALASNAWAIATRHKPGEIVVQSLASESGESVLVAVNDDRPFLYDSALQAVVAEGIRIRAAFHPIIPSRSGRSHAIDGGQSRSEDGGQNQSRSEDGGQQNAVSVIVLVLDRLADEGGQKLLETLRATFAQGFVAVRDWQAMRARLKAARDVLATRQTKDSDIREDLAFLDWLGDDHFTFLGARDYRLADDGAHGRLEPVEASGLGVLSDADARVIRKVADLGLSGAVRRFLDDAAPLIVTKSIARSLVHRRVHMDYVGIKLFDSAGGFCGERRFVGLFTSSAYNQSPRNIPLLRRKVAAVMTRAGLPPASHDGKALAHILDSFPRDELFQISDEELFETAMGILNLGGRPRVRLFLRFDRFDRFVSALVFAPRDHVDADASVRIHALLADALNGRPSAATAALDDSALVRIHYIIGRNEGPRPHVDVRALEHQIEAALKTWDDGFAEALEARHGASPRLLQRRAARFSPGYRGLFSPQEAAQDLDVLERLSASGDTLKIQGHAYARPEDDPSALHLKLYVLGAVLPLSVSLPIFENLGLKVIAEDAFPVSFRAGDGSNAQGVILDFAMERADGAAANLGAIRELLQDVFHAVLRGAAESDGFNRLVIGAGLAWRDVTILRMVGKFLRQAAIPFSQDYMEQALFRNPGLAGLLVQLFHARLDPATADTDVAARLGQAVTAGLRDVPSLDDDRILRRFRNVIENVLRTNFYQPDCAAIAIKLDSAKLDDLPAPRPWREIFVYAPDMEGVHLRFGRIARGGIRWSDRREDFRTEILGLVKAQQVKNAVIVPVGAKGGFYPKRLPASATREEALAIGVAAYKTMIGALLDVTDNLEPDGTIVPPPDVLRLDGDDPYLVVAADKGTATFSDIANGIAEARGFWLGDAFASGGSHGYDHKKMGITARGAWEAVKRHFREMGRDIQAQDFTVVGVGDMSGDVFGNGMLLSPHTRLVAAFDHRHIFLDPKGDPAKGFAERQRLFDLPRSSWDDYDRKLLGPGGGIFARSLKEIALSPEMRDLIGGGPETLSPAALITALLKAKVDLLWFGGIGTFIKARSQSNLDVGDRANDGVRIDGAEVGARVVGEGANLGVTQAGRIEYARGGGRIDTDAVDNSAGVDTSDHEVNLKILLSGPYRRGAFDAKTRDALLMAMTDDVARLVLADNYDQTLALSVAEACAAQDLDAHARFIRDLERRGKLDRAVEFLPSDADLQTLGHDAKGLTRPELAVLMAYAKLDLDAEILGSDLPDDPYFASVLAGYFPPKAAEQFFGELAQHRLKREIISTSIANRLVNLAGPVFVARMKEMSGATGAQVARAFIVAEGAFGFAAMKTRIDALDGQIPSASQTRLYGEIAIILRRLGLWFLGHAAHDDRTKDDLVASIALYRAAVENLRASYAELVSPEQAGEARARIAGFDAPADLATDIGLLPLLAVAPEIAQLARASGHDLPTVAALYFGVGALIGLDRLRALAARIAPAEHWDRLAIRRLVDDLFAAQRGLAQAILKNLPTTSGPDAAAKAITAWAEHYKDALARTRDFLAQLEVSGELSIAKLTLANSQIGKLSSF